MLGACIVLKTKIAKYCSHIVENQHDVLKSTLPNICGLDSKYMYVSNSNMSWTEILCVLDLKNPKLADFRTLAQMESSILSFCVHVHVARRYA